MWSRLFISREISKICNRVSLEKNFRRETKKRFFANDAGTANHHVINFRIVDQSRYTDILYLLYTNFHTDEPMSKTVCMIKDPSDKNPTLDTFALDGLQQVCTKNCKEEIQNRSLLSI